MSDPLTWSPISLGRWFGTTVRVHIILILFVAIRLVMSSVSFAADGRLPQFSHTACWLGLLLLALAIHELAHAGAAAWLDCSQEVVHLWPLGSLMGPSLSSRSDDHVLIPMAGPLASGLIALLSAVGLYFAWDAQFVWNPFGNPEGDTGAPRLAGGVLAAPLSPPWIAGWFGYLNWVLLLANLIPALPFDGGRLFRTCLAHASISPARDSIVAPYTARTCAVFLGIVGLIRLVVIWRADGLTLIALGLLIELLVRSEARMLEDGGYLDTGIFGYDFSEGYTSLDGGTAKVRPYRESALVRWRRRRSELRRQRRMAREAAEERRMDEILEKLHREGRSALSDEENRFLVRVSARLRNRTKSP
jgi:Zn-dependent protease